MSDMDERRPKHGRHAASGSAAHAPAPARTVSMPPQRGRGSHAAGAQRPEQAQPAASQVSFAPDAAPYGREAYSQTVNARKKKGGVWRVVFWVALVVLVASLLSLGYIGYSYWKGQNTYNDIAAQSGFTPPAQAAGLDSMTVDWDALRAINPETIAWIYVPGTNINYPITHTTDDEKYLKTDFYGVTNWAVSFGSIFLSADNAANFSDKNNIVYGHHMNDGSMFSQLADFDDQATFDDHRAVYILTPQGNYQLTTFSLVHCAADDPIAQTQFADVAEQVSYTQDKIDRSEVVASNIPSARDMGTTFTFATCDNYPTNGRWVLFAYISDSTVPGVLTAGGQYGSVHNDASLTEGSDAQAVDDAAKEIAA